MDSLYVNDLLYCRALPGCDTIGNAVYGTSYVGMWRSLVARLVRDQEVVGSSPVASTIYAGITVKNAVIPAFLLLVCINILSVMA